MPEQKIPGILGRFKEFDQMTLYASTRGNTAEGVSLKRAVQAEITKEAQVIQELYELGLGFKCWYVEEVFSVYQKSHNGDLAFSEQLPQLDLDTNVKYYLKDSFKMNLEPQLERIVHIFAGMQEVDLEQELMDCLRHVYDEKYYLTSKGMNREKLDMFFRTCLFEVCEELIKSTVEKAKQESQEMNMIGRTEHFSK